MGEERRLGVVQGAPARKDEEPLMRRKRGDGSSIHGSLASHKLEPAHTCKKNRVS